MRFRLLSTVYERSGLRSRGGFTILELVLYMAMFAGITAAFVSITSIATRVEIREVSSIEVSHQLTYIMQTIQRLAAESSAIIVNSNGNTSADTAPLGQSYPYLVLRMKDSSGSATDRDPIVIWEDSSDGSIKMRQGTGGGQRTDTLTTSAVHNTANDISFIKRTNYPGPDVVQINLTLAANTQNPGAAITRTLRSAVSHVSAASFDSNLLPGVDNSYSFGSVVNRWKDSFFSGTASFAGNVGIGTTAPNSKLEISGGYLQFSYVSAGAPTGSDCNSDSQRGRMVLDTTNFRLYLCLGSARGWDYVTLTN